MTRREVQRLRAAGLGASAIAERLGVSRATVSFHLRNLGESARPQFAVRYDWAAIREFFEAGHSARECWEVFGCSRAAWADALARGAITRRDHVEPLDHLLAAGRERSRQHVKARVLAAGLKQRRCELCGLSEWQGDPLSLELHHVNGDRADNRLANLQLLCPNCHSQTETWGVRNRRRRADC